MPTKTQVDFDVVVIGAGHNGLVTSAYLARHGAKVLLLEARDEVGGTAASENFHGSTVNICNCDHLTFRTTPVIEELGLESHGLRYLDVEPSQINGDWTTRKFWPMYHDLDATLEGLSSVNAGAVVGYRRYARAMVPLARLVLEAAANPPSKGSLISAVARRGGRGVLPLLRFSKMSAADVMREFFDDEAVIGPAMVTGPVVWGLSPETPGTGLGALTYALRHAARVGRPVGGSGQVTEAIKAAFLGSGGLLKVSTKATTITCDGNSVRSVSMNDGLTVTARVVVSACDPRRTFVDWLKNPPAKATALVAKWRNMAHQEGYESKIDAIVTERPVLQDLDYEWVASLGGSADYPTTVISPSLDELHRGAQLMANGLTMPRMGMFANSPTALDPSMSTVGEHVFSLEALYTPYKFTEGWASLDEPRRWLEQFGTLVQPGFLSSVKHWRAVTPAEYESRFHLPNGHATSFAGGPLAAFRGVDPELTRYHTPVKGLYLTGAATFPGAGVWGASGRNAALTIIKEMF